MISLRTILWRYRPLEICNNDIEGFNKGVSQLINDILDNQSVWVIFSDLDALDEVSCHLQASCKDYALNLLTKQSPGQNATQYLACGQLVSIVGSILELDHYPSSNPRTITVSGCCHTPDWIPSSLRGL